MSTTFGIPLAVRDDGAALIASGDPSGRPVWSYGNGKPLKRWVSTSHLTDTGDGTYGCLIHTEGAIALTQEGALSCLDNAMEDTEKYCSASPVGGRGRGFVDIGVRVGRTLGDSTSVLGGRRMQHVRLQDDGTYDVDAFYTGPTSVCAMVVGRDHATVAGTCGGAILRWVEGADQLSSALPEARPGAPCPRTIDDTRTHELHVKIRDNGLRGLAALADGRVVAAGARHLLLWDPRQERRDYIDLYTTNKAAAAQVHGLCSTGNGLSVVIFNNSIQHDGSTNALKTPTIEWFDVRRCSFDVSRPFSPTGSYAHSYMGHHLDWSKKACVHEAVSDAQGRLMVSNSAGGYRIDANDMMVRVISSTDGSSLLTHTMRSSPSGRYVAAFTENGYMIVDMEDFSTRCIV